MTTAVETRTKVDPRTYVSTMRELVSSCYTAAKRGDVVGVMNSVARLVEVRREVTDMVTARAKVRDKNDTDPYSGKRGRGVQPDEVAERAYDSGLEILYLLRQEISDGNEEDPEKRLYTEDALTGIESNARAVMTHFNEWCKSTPWSR